MLFCEEGREWVGLLGQYVLQLSQLDGDVGLVIGQEEAPIVGPQH